MLAWSGVLVVIFLKITVFKRKKVRYNNKRSETEEMHFSSDWQKKMFVKSESIDTLPPWKRKIFLLWSPWSVEKFTAVFLCWFNVKQRVKEAYNLAAKVILNFPAFWKLEKNVSSGITHYWYRNSSRLGPRSMRSSAQIESGFFVPKVYGTFQVKQEDFVSKSTGPSVAKVVGGATCMRNVGSS